MKKYKVLISLVLMALFLISSTFGTMNESDNIESQENLNIQYEKATVKHVEKAIDEYGQGYQAVTLVMDSGELKDKVVVVDNYLPQNLAYRIEVDTGDRVIVAIDNTGLNEQLYISDFYRNHVLLYLVIAFLVLLLIIGKTKGLKSMITITLTMVLVFKVLIPGILSGQNPLFLSIGISAIITMITICIVSGLNTKSLAAIIGTVSGVIIAALISIIIGNMITITGMMPDEAAKLLFLPNDIAANFKNLLFSGIIIGALGAVMDIAMSIASAIYEIYLANKNQSKKTLFKAGMAVGHDIMGTMSNTLILAYTGSSIPLLLLLSASGEKFLSITNMDIVATEIIRSLAGSIGLILTIPITAYVSVLLLKQSTILNKKG